MDWLIDWLIDYVYAVSAIFQPYNGGDHWLKVTSYEMAALTICLFVCLELNVQLENVSFVWRRYHCRWRAANFDLCSALMAIEHWGFFNVPHTLRLWPTVYNGNLWGPVTLTPVLLPSVSQWSCQYLFLRLRSVATGDRTPISRMWPLRAQSLSKFSETDFRVPRWVVIIDTEQRLTSHPTDFKLKMQKWKNL